MNIVFIVPIYGTFSGTGFRRRFLMVCVCVCHGHKTAPGRNVFVIVKADIFDDDVSTECETDDESVRGENGDDVIGPASGDIKDVLFSRVRCFAHSCLRQEREIARR